MNPKLNECFCSGKITKWNDFGGQELHKKHEKSHLFVHDSCEEVVDVSNKPVTLNVYSRNYTRKSKGGKMITQNSQPLQKEEDVIMGVTEGGEGGEGIKGFSSDDDDTSSEELIIISDIVVEVEKETQEEAAFEGVRCLLGDGRQEMESVIGIEEDQVLNQANYNGYALHQSCREGRSFLNTLKHQID